MYQDYFGIAGPPFSSAPSPEGLFLGAGHREALAALEWGLEEPTSFTLLTGEVGTGKTTLIDALAARRADGVRIARIRDPRLTIEEMLGDTLSQLGESYLGAGRAALMPALANSASRRRLALLVDEAQGLSDTVLEDLRLLSNLAEGAIKIILVGQPELAHRLAKPSLRQLNQRIGARSRLDPLTPAQVVDYVRRRVGAVGGDVDRIFAPGSLKLIARRSGGIPRRINILCHNAMVIAYANGFPTVGRPQIEEAVREYSLPTDRNYRASLLWTVKAPRRLLFNAGSGSALAVAAAGVLGLSIGSWRGPWPTLAARVAERAPLREQQAALPEVRETRWSADEKPPPEQTAEKANPADAGKPAAAVAAIAIAPAVPRESVAPAPKVSAASHSVVVQDGDSLSTIAERYLGSYDSATRNRLLAANPEITEPDLIYPGQNIRLVEK
jgi:general secretion pathway protein A